MSSSQLFKDLERVANITWQRGLKRRGLFLHEPDIDPGFLQTARGQAALELLQSVNADLEAPWAPPFWDLRARVKQAAIDNGNWDPHAAGDIIYRQASKRPIPKPPIPVRKATRRAPARPRAVATTRTARVPKVSLSRLVSIGLREAPDSGVTVTRLVDKHLRGGKAKSAHRLFGMPVVITTRGNTVRVAFAMESR